MTTYIDPALKLFGHLDRLEELRRGRRPAPVNIEIDLSNRCSLGCEWCHFGYTHTRGPLAGKRDKPAGALPGGDLMDTPLAHRILEQAAWLGVKSITWTGGGEPTLHADFDEIVAQAAECGLDQGVYTHGGHMPLARAALLKRLFTWVYVSLDAADRDSYRRAKGVDYFERACGGIRHLVQAEGAATVGVGFLLNRDNWRDGPAMIALARTLGADYCQFRPTVRYAQDAPGTVDEDTGWLDDCLAWLRSLDAPDVICDVRRFEMYRDWQGHGYSVCQWAELSTVITPGGQVWRCVNKREHAGALLGDLTSETLAEIWRARGGPCVVDGDCRVLCRGHVANVALDALLTPQPHANFI